MGRSNLFNRGYEKANKEIDKIEQERKKREGRLWRLFLKRDGDEVDIRFLTEEPISFYEHTVKKGNKFESIICTGEDCPLCEDDNPSFKGAYLVWDYTEYTDRNKKKHKGQLRLYVGGSRIVTQLERLSEKYGLTNRDWTVIRNGDGTATTYTFDRGDEHKLTRKEIENMLPDNYKEIYDGTAESLYTIVEKALQAELPSNSKKRSDDDYDDEDYDDDYDEEYDDEEDDNDYVDGEDEDGEERPRKSSVKKTSGKPTLSKSKEKSSAKSLFSSKRRR